MLGSGLLRRLYRLLSHRAATSSHALRRGMHHRFPTRAAVRVSSGGGRVGRSALTVRTSTACTRVDLSSSSAALKRVCVCLH